MLESALHSDAGPPPFPLEELHGRATQPFRPHRHLSGEMLRLEGDRVCAVQRDSNRVRRRHHVLPHSGLESQEGGPVGPTRKLCYVRWDRRFIRWGRRLWRMGGLVRDALGGHGFWSLGLGSGLFVRFTAIPADDHRHTMNG